MKKYKTTTSEKLQAFVAFIQDGIEAVREEYPQHYAFVAEHLDKTYLQVKKILLNKGSENNINQPA